MAVWAVSLVVLLLSTCNAKPAPKPKPGRTCTLPSPVTTGYTGVCTSGTSCKVSCDSSAVPPWFPTSGDTPTASCRDGNWVYRGCAPGCPAATAPTGYFGNCPAGLVCLNVSCDIGNGYVPVPAPPFSPHGLGLRPQDHHPDRGGAATAFCNRTTLTFQYVGCMLPCLATTAPYGYIGNCPAGVTCNSTTSTPALSCDDSVGYYPIPPQPRPETHSILLRGMDNKPQPPAGPTATCPPPGNVAFQYSGCAPGCAATTAPLGYYGSCAKGLVCPNITCDVGLGYYPAPASCPTKSHLGLHETDHRPGAPAPSVTCNSTTLTFQFAGCVLGCPASTAPYGYIGNCPAGSICNATVTCDASKLYFPIPKDQKHNQGFHGLGGGGGDCRPNGPTATCNATTHLFQYIGCAKGCSATPLPAGYALANAPNGQTQCVAGFTCAVACTSGKKKKGVASCAGNGAQFTFSGC